MTKKNLNKWIMYHEIHKLKRLGFSAAKIARHLVMDARTIGKYFDMDEKQYEQFLLKSSQRSKILQSYEKFVADKLQEYPDTSAAQIHDWLKENYSDFSDVSPRTVYNFVMHIRQQHNIPFERQYREYFPVAELPYGDQSQVDFGEYNMMQCNGKRKKVHFFAMVLSRSRMKFTYFLDKPFTAQTVIFAHEKAFDFFGGIPRTIVYDQDRTMIVDENIGDIILTDAFEKYTKSRNFKFHFCRKADPESKGKIENVIQYIKKNFLYNRTYSDIETLNAQALKWLERTANYLPHNYTKKSPMEEYIIEKEHLMPYTSLAIEHSEQKIYHVRKTNSISYKSNFYTLPSGTYQGTGTQVIIKEKNENIQIFNMKNQLLCSHVLSKLKGQTIANTNHRRDHSKSLDDMITQTISLFSDESSAVNYINEIRKKMPRYTRDHLQIILKTLTHSDRSLADKTLEFCIKNNLFNGHEWSEVFNMFSLENIKPVASQNIALLNKDNLEKAAEMPLTSNIETYQSIINQ